MSMSWDDYWAMCKLHLASNEKFFDREKPKLWVLDKNFLAAEFHKWLPYQSPQVQLEVVRQAPPVVLDLLLESGMITEAVYNDTKKPTKHAHHGCHSSATRAKRPKLVRE